MGTTVPLMHEEKQLMLTNSVNFCFFSVENPKHCDFVKLRTMLM